jgi:hypothetical protein
VSVYVSSVIREAFIFVYGPPVTVPRYTLYPETVDVLAIQFDVAECGTTAVAVKFTPVTLAPLTVEFWLAGVKVKPLLLGVRVYAPFASPLNVYAPAVFAVAMALAAPLSVTVAPLPPAVGLIVPEMLNVCAVAVKFTPVTFAPLTVAFVLLGLNV